MSEAKDATTAGHECDRTDGPRDPEGHTEPAREEERDHPRNDECTEHHEDPGDRHRERDDDSEECIEEKKSHPRGPWRVGFSEGYRKEGLPKDEVDHAEEGVDHGPCG